MNEEELSLRDYFAAHCPLTLLEFSKGVDAENAKAMGTAKFIRCFAEARYQYADAMLEVRKQ